jgi:hypothetical protein
LQSSITFETAMKADSQSPQDEMAAQKEESAVHSAKIGAVVKDAGVTLDGEVIRYLDTWTAESASQRVSGATALAVEPQAAARRICTRDGPSWGLRSLGGS